MSYNKDDIWKLGRVVPDLDKNRWRKDACGAMMDYSKYGDTDSKYGWQVDHIVPDSFLEEKGVSEDDRDNIINLRPMQWKNNDVKDKDCPKYDSAVTSSERRNIDKAYTCMVDKQKQQELKCFFAKHGGVDITTHHAFGYLIRCTRSSSKGT